MKIYEVSYNVWYEATAEDGENRPHDDVVTRRIGVREGGLETAIEKLDASLESDYEIDYYDLLSVSLVAEAEL